MKFIISILLFALSVSAEPRLYSKASLLFGSNWSGPGIVVGADTQLEKTFFWLGSQTGFYWQAQTPVVDADFVITSQMALIKDLIVYIQIPIGVTWAFSEQQLIWGYNFGLVPGVRYHLSEHWEVLAELGLVFHGLIGNPGRNILGGIINLGVSYVF